MENKMEMNVNKTVLIGDASVGKTSILNWQRYQRYNPAPSPTIGASFSTYTVKCLNGKLVKLEEWDTAGQCRYRTLTPMYVRHAHVVLIVYDITNRDSFTNIENYWKIFLDENKSSMDSNVLYVLIANKCDLSDEDHLIESGEKLAAKYGWDFYITSATNGHNIMSMFNDIVEKMSNREPNASSEVLEATLRSHPYLVPKKQSTCCFY